MAPLRVFLISDDQQLLARLRRLLRTQGHSVAGVSHQPSAQGAPTDADLVILDARALTLLVPGNGGEQPMVYLFGPGQHALFAQALDAGPHAVVAEPLTGRALAVAVATALARARWHSTAARQAQHLRWLQQAAHAIATCETVEEILHLAADHVQNGLRYDRIGIALVDVQANCLRDWLSTDHTGRRYIREGNPISLAADSPIWRQRAARELLREGSDVFYTTDAWGETPDDLRERLDGLTGEGLVVAMRLSDRPLGWIAVDNLISGRPICPEEAPTLVAFAREVAVAIERARVATRRLQEFATLTEVSKENAELREVDRRRATIAEALVRATAAIAFSLDQDDLRTQVLGLLRTVVPFDSASLLLIDHGYVTRACGAGDVTATTMQPFPVQDDPIFAQWLRDGRTEPELIVDTRLDPRWRQLGSRNVAFIEAIRCYIGAPLVLDGDLVGMLCLANRAPNSFDALAVDAAAEFAERLARALRNARLYEMERTANARLQRLIRLQDDFVATVSHELRTPLTSILGFAENLTLFWEMMGDVQRRSSVEKIQRAGARLDRLIRDLLQLARSDPEALHLLPRRIILAPLIAHAADEIAGKYPGQMVTLSPGVQDAACWADADRVSQILINLLDNAAKYSPDGSPVAVEWEQEGEWGILTVCDGGRGIHPDDVPGLFRRFGKLDATTRAGHVGTGLGLYICKQLAEAMGGQIWYEPINPSSSSAGSRFRVRLPLHQPAPALRDQPVPAP